MIAFMKDLRLFENSRAKAVVFVVLALVFMLLFPHLAYADWMSDIKNNINDMVLGWLNGVSEAMFGTGVTLLNQVTVDSALSAPFDNLFDTSGGAVSPLYTFARSVSQSVIKPVAHAILSLTMLLQLLKITQKMEGAGALPAIKDIVFLMLFCLLFMTFINHAADMCEMMYTVVLKIILKIRVTLGLSAINMSVMGGISAPDIPAAILGIIVALIFVLVCVLAWGVAMGVSWARALELYVLTAFSPIPFSLLGFEETRSWGLGYIKHFLSVCLAGAVLVFILLCYPLLLSAFVGGSISVNVLTDGLSVVVLSVLLIITLLKSGAWARSVLGG
jgi:hypothetical protein